MTRNIFLIILIGFMMSCQNRSKDDKIQESAGPDLSKLEIANICQEILLNYVQIVGYKKNYITYNLREFSHLTTYFVESQPCNNL